MKYRVRVDLSFDGQTDAQALYDSAVILAGNAVSVNEGQANEVLSFCEMEMCRHDEGLPCTQLERLEIRQTGGAQA